MGHPEFECGSARLPMVSGLGSLALVVAWRGFWVLMVAARLRVRGERSRRSVDSSHRSGEAR